MTVSETAALFKCLADASRLELLRSLMISPMYGEQLAERLGLTPATVSFHVKKLEAAGLVESRKEQYYMMHSLRSGALNRSLLELLSIDSPADAVQDEREQQYREKVLASFFQYGKLQSIPVQLKKRRIILEKLVEGFEPGRVYSEREVNIILADAHDDFCTLRRELIAEKLMTRDHGSYQRV